MVYLNRQRLIGSWDKVLRRLVPFYKPWQNCDAGTVMLLCDRFVKRSKLVSCDRLVNRGRLVTNMRLVNQVIYV